jgi:hypothetical protein
MTITAQRIFTRPNTDTPFFQGDVVWQEHMYTNYTLTGKRLGVHQTLSPDGLILTTITQWKDQESLTEFRADRAIQGPREEYCAQHSITITDIVE